MDGTVCDGCTKKKCPNKIESFWKDKDGNVKPVTDCAPKRTMIMLQEMTNRQIAQQGAIETMRNELDIFNNQIKALSQLKKPRRLEQDNDLQALPDRQLQHRSRPKSPPVVDPG